MGNKNRKHIFYNQLFCAERFIAKGKRAPIVSSDRLMTRPIELIHTDVRELMKRSSLINLTYSSGIVYDCTPYLSDFLQVNHHQVY